MPAPPPNASPARTAPEIAAELRRAFERAMLERHGRTPAPDPVLDALFAAVAAGTARVYAEAEQVFPDAVFDDLVAALGVPPRPAHPAQTVVAFTGAARPEVISPDAPLTGVSARGEHLPFRLDLPVQVGPVRLAFAAVAEAGRMHLLPGAALADASGAPVPLPAADAPLAPPDAALGPTLFLAFDADDAHLSVEHLSGLGLFFDVPGAGHPAARALARSAWQLLADGGPAGGVATEDLVLRARPGPGGAWVLAWAADAPDASPNDQAGEPPNGLVDNLPDTSAAGPPGARPAALGPYGPLCWRWPAVPPGRRARSRPPRAVAAVLPALLPPDRVPPELAATLRRPLAWVQVALPAEAEGVAAAVRRVVAHAAPASNVEAFAVLVAVGALGETGAYAVEVPAGRHLVAVLGVLGEQGAEYAGEPEPDAPLVRGRYRARGEVVELRPARGPTGRFDQRVLVRLLFTDGVRANGLRAGDVAARGAAAGQVGFGAASVVTAAGGSAPPAQGAARVRFADAVRTRERVITPADVAVAARAFEPRVLATRVRDVVEVAAGPDGPLAPRRVTVVTARVRPADFGDPAAELPVLAATVGEHLRARAAAGTALRVEAAGDAPSERLTPGAPRASSAASADVLADPRAPDRPPAARMPDLVRPRRGARHTVDSALRALRALGIDDARVTLESAGPGWAPGAVVHQHPPPGAPLDGPVGAMARVTLRVAGPGAVEALPYALRDAADPADGAHGTFGVDALVGLFDGPDHKLRHHLRGGGEFFAWRPDDPASVRRWIEQVFQVDPAPWHPARWPALARLLPTLHRAAGREAGLAHALRLVFGLPLARVALERAVLPAPGGRPALGRRAARLGVDALLGAGRAEVARLALTLGPVPLAAYHAHAGAALAAERRALYELVVPLALAGGVRERWLVGDPDAPARLGGAGPAESLGTSLGVSLGVAAGAPEPAALGLTTRLARAP